MCLIEIDVNLCINAIIGACETHIGVAEDCGQGVHITAEKREAGATGEEMAKKGRPC